MKVGFAVGQENGREVKDLAIILFEHIENQISRVDLKAQLILAADAILVATISTIGNDSVRAVLNANDLITDRIAAASTIAMFLTLLLSFYFALAVVKPSLKSPPQPTLVYFGQIAAYKQVDKFITAFQSQSTTEIESALLAEVYAKSGIAKSKFTRIHWSVNFLLLALFFWSASQIMHAIP